MSMYRNGRSSDYTDEDRQPKRYAVKPYETPAEIADQFERMARGLAPVQGQGQSIVWVQDDTITPELRAWCAETAAMVKREAEIRASMKPRARVELRRNVGQIEAEIAAVLALRPDATAHDIRIVTGIEHSRILRSETWALTHMSHKEQVNE